MLRDSDQAGFRPTAKDLLSPKGEIARPPDQLLKILARSRGLGLDLVPTVFENGSFVPGRQYGQFNLHPAWGYTIDRSDPEARVRGGTKQGPVWALIDPTELPSAGGDLGDSSFIGSLIQGIREQQGGEAAKDLEVPPTSRLGLSPDARTKLFSRLAQALNCSEEGVKPRLPSYLELVQAASSLPIGVARGTAEWVRGKTLQLRPTGDANFPMIPVTPAAYLLFRAGDYDQGGLNHLEAVPEALVVESKYAKHPVNLTSAFRFVMTFPTE